MAMKIDNELCTQCGDCEPECPTSSVVKRKGLYVIKAESCNECEDRDAPQCILACAVDDCIVPLAA